jgi:hypothetical protein
MRHSRFNSRRSPAGSFHSRTGCNRTKSGPAARVPVAYQREAIRRANGRCQMCGCTVAPDGAELTVDFMARGSLGSTDVPRCVWAICDECDAGMKACSPTLGAEAELIGRLNCYKSVHVRIGELLKAFGIEERVPSSLIEAVAGQHNWRQRLRELRYPVIGWKIKPFRFRTPSGRASSGYALISYEPWPPDPTGAVREFGKGHRKQ